MAKKQAMPGAKQIDVMRSLGQQAASWLTGINARSLRDYGDIPRDPETARYNACELFAWAANRKPRPSLDDADFERLLLVADCIEDPTQSDLAAIGVADTLQALEEKHGDGVRVLLADTLLDRLRSWAESHRSYARAPTAADVRNELQKRAERLAIFTNLQMVARCDKCRRFRIGRKWVTENPHPDYALTPGACHECFPPAAEFCANQ